MYHIILPELAVAENVTLPEPQTDVGDTDATVTVTLPGSLIVTIAVAIQLLLSVTVTVCVPAFNVCAVAVVSKLSHLKVYPPLPPTGVTVADPLLSPFHTTGLTWVALPVSKTGSVMVTLPVVAEQLFRSVTL